MDRFNNPREDALTELVQLQIAKDGELDLDYLVKELEVLVFAGNVTTAHMLASAMVFLCQDPDLMRRVRADHELIKPLLEETLRLEAPVQWRQRWAKEDTEIAGVPIPMGSGVIIMYNSGNRDERRWGGVDPAEFDLDRPQVSKHHLAFGYGIHRCAGATLARLEGRIALERLLTRLADIELDTERSDLSHIDSVHFRAPKKVVLRFRKSSGQAVS
jgi:cytochrome P450